MIELKITVDSAADLVSQISSMAVAFGTQSLTAQQERDLRNADINRADDAVREEMQEKRRGRKPKAEAVEVEPEANAPEPDAASEDTLPAGEKSPDSTDGTGTSASTPSSGQTATNTASPSETSDEDYFEQIVTPTVLELVRSKGKPWVVAVLSDFGVERASDLKGEPDRLRELVETLHARAQES